MANETLSARSENILNIMLATDNHLGYNEKDSHRGDTHITMYSKMMNHI